MASQRRWRPPLETPRPVTIELRADGTTKSFIDRGDEMQVSYYDVDGKLVRSNYYPKEA